MAVGALVLGIISAALSLVCSWLPYAGQIFSPILGVIGIVLGVMGMKKEPEKAGQAKAGLILSIVGLVLSLLILAAWIIFTVFIATEAGTPDFWRSLK